MKCPPDLQPQRLYTKAAVARLMGIGADSVKRLLNESKLEQAERRGKNKWATITGAGIIRFTRSESSEPLRFNDKPTAVSSQRRSRCGMASGGKYENMKIW